MSDIILHGSVDIETLSLRADAVLVSAAVTVFDPSVVVSFDDLLKATRVIHFDLNDVAKYGTHIDPATVRWWMLQSDEARINTFNLSENLGYSLKGGLSELKNIFSGLEHVWTLGYMDIAVLNFAGSLCGAGEVINYKQHVDLRAFRTRDCRPEYPDNMVPHDAAHDSAYQAMVIQQCRLDSSR